MLVSAECAKDVPNKYGVTPVYEAVLKGEVILEKKTICLYRDFIQILINFS